MTTPATAQTSRVGASTPRRCPPPSPRSPRYRPLASPLPVTRRRRDRDLLSRWTQSYGRDDAISSRRKRVLASAAHVSAHAYNQGHGQTVRFLRALGASEHPTPAPDRATAQWLQWLLDHELTGTRDLQGPADGVDHSVARVSALLLEQCNHLLSHGRPKSVLQSARLPGAPSFARRTTKLAFWPVRLCD
jgi:hypothetical protein